MKLVYRMKCTSKEVDMVLINVDTQEIIKFNITKKTGDYKSLLRYFNDENTFFCYKDWNVSTLILVQLLENYTYLIDNASFIEFADAARIRIMDGISDDIKHLHRDFIAIDLSLLERNSGSIDVIVANTQSDNKDKLTREAIAICRLITGLNERLVARHGVMMKLNIFNVRYLVKNKYSFCEYMFKKLYRKFLKDDLFDPEPNLFEPFELEIDRYYVKSIASSKLNADMKKMIPDLKSMEDTYLYNGFSFNLRNGLSYCKKTKSIVKGNILKIDLRGLKMFLIDKYINEYLKASFKVITKSDSPHFNFIKDELFRSLLDPSVFTFLPEVYAKVSASLSFNVLDMYNEISRNAEVLLIGDFKMVIKVNDSDLKYLKEQVLTKLHIKNEDITKLSAVAIESANDYMCSSDSEITGEGRFNIPNILQAQKQPKIVYKAIHEFLKLGTPIKDTMDEDNNIFNYSFCKDGRNYFVSYSSRAVYTKINKKKVGVEYIDEDNLISRYAIEKPFYASLTNALLDKVNTTQLELF